MKHLTKVSYFIFIFFFASCLDDKINSTLITDDYYLNWTFEKSDQALIKSSDNGKSGRIIIPESVFAIGYDDRYIIAKQYPNKQREISKRLFGKSDKEGFILEDPNDTIYLAEDDSTFLKNGKWYRISNGWNPPANLKPFKEVTNYYILDRKSDTLYIYKLKKQFEIGKQTLGIPNELQFTIIDSELE